MLHVKPTKRNGLQFFDGKFFEFFANSSTLLNSQTFDLCSKLFTFRKVFFSPVICKCCVVDRSAEAPRPSVMPSAIENGILQILGMYSDSDQSKGAFEWVALGIKVRERESGWIKSNFFCGKKNWSSSCSVCILQEMEFA